MNLIFMKSIKSQISIIELPFVFLFFSVFIGYIYFNPVDISYNSQESLDSFIDSIYYSENFRDLIFSEDLSNSAVTEDWSNLQIDLDSAFSNYELLIANKTVSKTIFSCNSSYEEVFTQRILSIQNSSVFEFRKITLGVCS